MPADHATPPGRRRGVVPSSEPALDEVGRIWSVPASPIAESASARIVAEARQRARATLGQGADLSAAPGLDDDSDDEALCAPRRPRRAASQRTYTQKLSLTQPADAHTTRQRGMPQPLTAGASGRYSLEALLRDKARRARRGLLPHQYADIDALVARMDAPSTSVDAHAALWTTLAASEAEQLVQLLQEDVDQRKSGVGAPLFWRAEAPPILAIDPGEAAVLACLRWPPWLSPDLVTSILRLCLATDERIARRARTAVATRSACLAGLVAPLLAAIGADPVLLSHATGAAVVPLPAWSMPSVRSVATVRLWQLLACYTWDEQDATALLPVLVHLRVAMPLRARPWVCERVLHRLSAKVMDVDGVAARLVRLGHALDVVEQVELVRAIPMGLGAVRASVAWHLVLHAPYEQLQPDLGALAHVWEDGLLSAPLESAPLAARVALVSLALSHLLAWLDGAQADAQLAALAPLVQGVWALHRRIPDAQGSAALACR
ncbi:hypothetical protein MNAN1_003714 [Malassezia nana]|uniref:Uncharacterized protein n=1 Tax=Malassezia nana TaxID=180528 RepID=A0AAF0J3Z9_9BASI|nr:hypothetical protein MNAN1_003714 [Malassezia nana]